MVLYLGAKDHPSESILNLLILFFFPLRKNYAVFSLLCLLFPISSGEQAVIPSPISNLSIASNLDLNKFSNLW